MRNGPNTHPNIDAYPLIYRPVDVSRTISTSTVDPPTGEYGRYRNRQSTFGRYRHRPSIHLRENMIDRWSSVKYGDTSVVDLIDESCGVHLHEDNYAELFHRRSTPVFKSYLKSLIMCALRESSARFWLYLFVADCGAQTHRHMECLLLRDYDDCQGISISFLATRTPSCSADQCYALIFTSDLNK